MLRINFMEVRRRRWLVVLMVLSVAALSCCFFSFDVPFSLGVTFVQAQSSSESFSTDNSKPSTTTTTATTTTTTATPSDGLSLEVVELTSTNFATTVNDGNVWLIEFYTSWCKHCQNFKTSYDNIAMNFHSAPQEKVRVAKVDCNVEKALATRFGVRGYPSFYLVSGWNVYEFEESRSESSLISFARGGYKKQNVGSHAKHVRWSRLSDTCLILLLAFCFLSSPIVHPMDGFTNGSHGNTTRYSDLRRNTHR